MKQSRRRKRTWFGRHGLSVVAAALLALWFCGYIWLDPHSHLSAFCGNAIADWSGSLVIILGTKFLYEVGSRESKPFHSQKFHHPAVRLLAEHSLLIATGLMALAAGLAFWQMSPDSKWGEVMGNLLSEGVQMAGLVFLTKRLVEVGSKE